MGSLARKVGRSKRRISHREIDRQLESLVYALEPAPGTEGYRAYEVTEKADKGHFGGSCNRTACQAPNAQWFNTSTRAYYCTPCARDINRWALHDAGFEICFPTSGDEKVDRQLKFGNIVITGAAT